MTKKIKKKLDKATIEKKESFKKQLKKFEKQGEPQDLQEDTEQRLDALEYYNNLSEEQKVAFSKELEKKKIRDSYIKYLKYVYPNFIITKFHALLANICQSVVQKVEKGETVRLCISVPPQHGKTTTITKTLPSWFVGRNPGRWAILTAYNADIAEEFSDNNRQLIKQYGKENGKGCPPGRGIHPGIFESRQGSPGYFCRQEERNRNRRGRQQEIHRKGQGAEERLQQRPTLVCPHLSR